MTAAVSISSIEKRFGTTRTLEGVSLDVAPGEFITLVGPSGCGKSTLLRILAGLIPQDGGSISIDGAPVDHLPPKARDIAMVFQSYALYPHMSVGDNIATPLKIQRLPAMARAPLVGSFIACGSAARKSIEDDVRQVAEQVELSHLLERMPSQLSGGQRQRVALARAMVRKPRVFLMDEPLSNLDARLRVHMRGELSALHRHLGATFIYVTHDQVEAMTMSSRVALMMDGEIVQVATPQEIYSNPADVRVARFIGSPEINLLPATADADGRIILDGYRTTLATTKPGKITIGLRPEILTLDEGRSELSLIVKLERMERLGHDVLLHLRRGLHEGGSITMRLPAAEADALQAQGKFSGAIAVGARARDALLFSENGARVASLQPVTRPAAHVLEGA